MSSSDEISNNTVKKPGQRQPKRKIKEEDLSKIIGGTREAIPDPQTDPPQT